MDLTRFFTALTKVGRTEGSAETSNFTLTMSLRYRFDHDALVDDAADLHTWADEIRQLGRHAHIAGEFDLASLLVVESIVAEFHDALDAAVASIELERLEAFDDDADDPLDPGFFAELDTELSSDDAEVLSDEFWSIIDANFEEVDGECQCPACTAAADIDEMHDTATCSAAEIASAVTAVATEAYLAAHVAATHPSMRSTVERYASEWSASYNDAAAAGPYQLAEFVIKLTDLCDDTMFMLLAKHGSMDGFADRSRAVLTNVSRQLALV